MKTIKILGFIILIAFGIFMVIFGGYDDSPGAQGLGVLMTVGGLWSVIRVWKKK